MIRVKLQELIGKIADKLKDAIATENTHYTEFTTFKDKVGTSYTNLWNGTKSVGTSAVNIMATSEIPKGTYVGWCRVRFASNSSSYRRVSWSTSKTGNDLTSQEMAVTGGVTVVRVPLGFHISQGDTFYINAQSGVTVNANSADYFLVRIGE